MNDLDAAIVGAMRTSRKALGENWRQLLRQHRHCAGFRTTQNPVERKLGFICNCTGQEIHNEIDIRDLKELLPDVRASVQRALQDLNRKGMKEKRRKQRKANKRAEALLFRYLTKEQKWSLRASKAFTVKGKDGHHYEIHAHWGNNVYRYEDGKRRYRFCVISDYKTPVPVYDLMLAQKLMLETNPRAFLDIAVVRDEILDDWWNNGKHIDNPEVEPVPSHNERMGAFQERLQNVVNPEHQDLEGIEYLQALEHLNKLAIYDLLVPDVGTEERVHFTDVCQHGVAFGLNADLEVVPIYDNPAEVPKIDEADNHDRILKLITGVPAAVYKSIAQVQGHFAACDLHCWKVLINPETDKEWAASSHPIWHDQPTVLGVRKIKDERVPKGKAWYVADAETFGVHVQWMDSPHRGYLIFNLNGVAIYEPHADQETLQRVETGQAGIRARIVNIQEAEAEAREQAADRILVRQGSDG